MLVGLEITGGLLIALAIYAWIVYSGAVAIGHRALVHVVAAASYVAMVEVVAITSVEHNEWQAWLLLATNVVGIVAMLALAQRFR